MRTLTDNSIKLKHVLLSALALLVAYMVAINVMADGSVVVETVIRPTTNVTTRVWTELTFRRNVDSGEITIQANYDEVRSTDSVIVSRQPYRSVNLTWPQATNLLPVLGQLRSDYEALVPTLIGQ